jgi:Tfp pilus assembly pilus retraction ATPase PilT
MEIGFKDGNRTIDQSIAHLLDNGFITYEEAMFHCREKRSFEAPAPVSSPEQPAKKTKSIWT